MYCTSSVKKTTHAMYIFYREFSYEKSYAGLHHCTQEVSFCQLHVKKLHLKEQAAFNISVSACRRTVNQNGQDIPQKRAQLMN
jgi:hypothetical protein